MKERNDARHALGLFDQPRSNLGRFHDKQLSGRWDRWIVAWRFSAAGTRGILQPSLTHGRAIRKLGLPGPAGGQKSVPWPIASVADRLRGRSPPWPIASVADRLRGR